MPANVYINVYINIICVYTYIVPMKLYVQGNHPRRHV